MKATQIIELNDGFKVPSPIGHNYTPLRVLDLHMIYCEPLVIHRRLKVFANKGLTCVYCREKTGVHLIKASNGSGTYIDVYTADFELITVDHIVPKSKGGTDDISNMCPVCNTCNTKKKNHDIIPDIVSVKLKGSTEVVFQGSEREVYAYLIAPDMTDRNDRFKIIINPIFPNKGIKVNDWISDFHDICALKQWEQIGVDIHDLSSINFMSSVDG